MEMNPLADRVRQRALHFEEALYDKLKASAFS